MNPTCPTDYTCQFTLVKPRVVYHTIGPWYNHTAGWIVAIVAIIALASVIAYALQLRNDRQHAKANQAAQDKQREHELAIEEQRTMQIDSAKGNPEMLKIVKDQQASYNRYH
jgi:uncharacterized protein HemX